MKSEKKWSSIDFLYVYRQFLIAYDTADAFKQKKYFLNLIK